MLIGCFNGSLFIVFWSFCNFIGSFFGLGWYLNNLIFCGIVYFFCIRILFGIIFGFVNSEKFVLFFGIKVFVSLLFGIGFNKFFLKRMFIVLIMLYLFFLNNGFVRFLFNMKWLWIIIIFNYGKFLLII